MNSPTRIMYDSADIYNIPPTGSQLVAYYTTGRYQESVEVVKARFPGQSVVPIDVLGTNPHGARVLDVETGDATPESTEAWIERWNATNPAFHNGGRPVIYCNRSTIPAVRAGTGQYILGKDYYLWVATLDGTLYTGLGVVACQRATITENIWHYEWHYDESVVYSPQWMPNAA